MVDWVRREWGLSREKFLKMFRRSRAVYDEAHRDIEEWACARAALLRCQRAVKTSHLRAKLFPPPIRVDRRILCHKFLSSKVKELVAKRMLAKQVADQFRPFVAGFISPGDTSGEPLTACLGDQAAVLNNRGMSGKTMRQGRDGQQE